METFYKLSKLKVWHISRQGSKNGGAAAFRMHHALLEAGYQSDIVIKNSYNDPGTKKMLTSHQVNWSRLKKKIASYFPKQEEGFKTNSSYYFFGVDEQQQPFSTSELMKKFSFQPDVIIVYFMDEFLNFKSLYELQQATGAKIYIYPMDMGPLTGGCHYTWDCEGYKNDCGACPAILSKEDTDRASVNLSLKKKYIDVTDLTVLSASQWLLENINESQLFKNKKAYKLLLPVDGTVFRPHPQKEARERFNLQTGKKTIFLGAQYLRDRRKGLAQLLQSFQTLVDLIKGTPLENNIQLLIAGREDKTFLSALPFPYRFIGLIDNDTVLPYAYSAADVFVCPSLQDAGPMMINESVMCGTPVVAFDMGVALDLVISGTTGYRAPLRDTDDFAKGIFQVLSKSEEEHRLLRDNCRQMASSKYSAGSLVTRLEDILAKDLEKSKKDAVL